MDVRTQVLVPEEVGARDVGTRDVGTREGRLTDDPRTVTRTV